MQWQWCGRSASVAPSQLFERARLVGVARYARLLDMPRISEFFGIVIAMYYNDHAPPHFHAKYAEREATFSIDSLDILEGSLPRRATGLVVEWGTLHRSELKLDWDLARRGRPLNRIAPLE